MNDTLLLGMHDGSIIVLSNDQHYQQIARITVYASLPINNIVPTFDGTSLLVETPGHRLQIIDLTSRKVVAISPEIPSDIKRIRLVGLHPAGSLALLRATGDCHLLEPASLATKVQFKTSLSPISVSHSNSLHLLAFGFSSGLIRWADTVDPYNIRFLAQRRVTPEPIQKVAFHLFDSILAAATGHHIHLFRLTSYLGRVAVDGQISGLSWHANEDSTVCVTAVTAEGRTVLYKLAIPADLKNDQVANHVLSNASLKVCDQGFVRSQCFLDLHISCF